jgi:polar amino acid transport system substrate-binding protein
MKRRLLTLLAALVALLGASDALATPPPTARPGILTVGLNMPSPGFEVGSVKGHDVRFARGFEVDLARAIAADLGIKEVAFYQEAQFSRLLAAGPKPWDIALGEVSITDARAAQLTISIPYLDASQGVLLRRGLTPLVRTRADLTPLRLCTQRGTTSADVVTDVIRPTRPAKLYGNVTRMVDALQAGRCDAVVYDAPILATLRAQTPERYGPLAGVIDTHEQYGVLLPKGSPLEIAVNTAIGRLIAGGRIATLSKRWLASDMRRLPSLS